MIKKIVGDVWSFETPDENIACDMINNIYQKALKRSGTKERNILKDCFEDGWDTIKEKFEVEGSVWYVWYMDGVNQHIANQLSNQK